MARLRYNGLTAALGASLTSSATSVTFAAALTHSNGVAVPTLSGGDYIPLTILDSSGNVSEIVYLTAYTSGGTTGTITRACETTVTGVAHSSGDKVVHGATVADIAPGIVLLKKITLASDAASLAFTSTDIPTTGYSHLRLQILGRTTLNDVDESLSLTINGDTTTANYRHKYWYGSTNSNATGPDAMFLAAVNAPAARPGLSDLDFFDFLGSWQKLVKTSYYSPGSQTEGLGAIEWFNTAAITSISLAPATGSNFVAGTKAWLYGIV